MVENTGFILDTNEKIYSKLGFIKTDEMQEKNGIKYIPMEYKLWI